MTRRPERKQIVNVQTLVQTGAVNEGQVLEASAGFEPAYTDLQAMTKAFEIKRLSANAKLDIARTKRERENVCVNSQAPNAGVHVTTSPAPRSRFSAIIWTDGAIWPT